MLILILLLTSFLGQAQGQGELGSPEGRFEWAHGSQGRNLSMKGARELQYSPYRWASQPGEGLSDESDDCFSDEESGFPPDGRFFPSSLWSGFRNSTVIWSEMVAVWVVPEVISWLLRVSPEESLLTTPGGLWVPVVEISLFILWGSTHWYVERPLFNQIEEKAGNREYLFFRVSALTVPTGVQSAQSTSHQSSSALLPEPRGGHNGVSSQAGSCYGGASTGGDGDPPLGALPHTLSHALCWAQGCNGNPCERRIAADLSEVSGEYEKCQLPEEYQFNEENEKDILPLHKAIEANQLAIVEALIKCGASTGIKDSKKRTPLAVILEQKERELNQVIACIELLVKKGGVKPNDHCCGAKAPIIHVIHQVHSIHQEIVGSVHSVQ